MSDRRRNRTAVAVLVLVSLVLLTMDYRQGEEGPISALQRGALSLLGPVQEGFSDAVRPVGDAIGSVAQLAQLREQVGKLEKENQELRDRLVSQADLERQLDELEAQLDMRREQGWTTTAARVIAQAPGQFEWRVLIDVGSDHGVRPPMAVVTTDGLVGKVVQASRQNAWVQLLTSPTEGVAVRVTIKGYHGWLRGRGARPFQLEVRNQEADIPAGTEVVTRAAVGSATPDGIPIGVVAGEADDVATSRYRSVQPYVDFSRLNVVQVILDYTPPPEQLDESVPPIDVGRPTPPPDEPDPPPGTPGQNGAGGAPTATDPDAEGGSP